MSLTDRLWNTIFDPVLAMRQLVSERPLAQGLIIYIISAALMIIINQGVDTLKPLEEALRLPADYIWLLGSTGIIFSLLVLFCGAGFLSLLSEIIYKRGNGLGLLVGLCFASLPGVFGPVLQYGATLLGINWLGHIFSLITIVWVMVLQVLAVRAAFDISTGKALFLFFSPFFIIIFIGFVLITLILISSLPAF